MIVYRLFVLNRNTWNHKTSCKSFLSNFGIVRLVFVEGQNVVFDLNNRLWIWKKHKSIHPTFYCINKDISIIPKLILVKLINFVERFLLISQLAAIVYCYDYGFIIGSVYFVTGQAREEDRQLLMLQISLLCARVVRTKLNTQGIDMALDK